MNMRRQLLIRNLTQDKVREGPGGPRSGKHIRQNNDKCDGKVLYSDFGSEALGEQAEQAHKAKQQEIGLRLKRGGTTISGRRSA